MYYDGTHNQSESVQSSDWRNLRTRLPIHLGPQAVATSVLYHFRVEKPPVNVFSLAQQMGIRVQRSYALGSNLAQLDSRLSPALITVNALDSNVRQRFSVAHELAHALFDPPGVLHRESSFSTSDPVERRANEFASHLLMPLPWVERLAAAGWKQGRLAKLFDVSIPSMAWQLRKLL